MRLLLKGVHCRGRGDAWQTFGVDLAQRMSCEDVGVGFALDTSLVSSDDMVAVAC